MMPQLIKKIIQYRSFDNELFTKGVYNLPKPVLHQYTVGDLSGGLKPEGAKIDIDESQMERFPLFNKENLLKITECIGRYGLIHIQIEPKKYLKGIYLEPDNVTLDILALSGEHLLYEFYNPSAVDTVTIRATLADDTEEIYTKIKKAGADLEYREYIIRRSLIKPGVAPIDKPKVEYSEWLTVKQVAELLGISEQAVNMRSHRGKLIKHKIGGALRFKKSELEK